MSTSSGFFCWRCGEHFTMQPTAGFIRCPICGNAVAKASSPIWLEGTAWCNSCKWSYGIVERAGVEPVCPRCWYTPTGERRSLSPPINNVPGEDNGMSLAQLEACKKLVNWIGGGKFTTAVPSLLAQEFYFVCPPARHLLSSESVQKCIQIYMS